MNKSQQLDAMCVEIKRIHGARQRKSSLPLMVPLKYSHLYVEIETNPILLPYDIENYLQNYLENETTLEELKAYKTPTRGMTSGEIDGLVDKMMQCIRRKRSGEREDLRLVL